MAFKKVLLIHPSKNMGAGFVIDVIPMGLEYLAAYIQKHVQKVDIIDLANGYNRESAQAGTDDQRLGIVVADNADPLVPMQLGQVGFELGAEIIVFDIVDGAFVSPVVFDGQAPPFGSKMRMIVGAEKEVS